MFYLSDEVHFLSTEHVESRMQQRFELMCRNRKMAIALHQLWSHDSMSPLKRGHRTPTKLGRVCSVDCRGLFSVATHKIELGQPNNQTLLVNLEAKGPSYKYLERAYILAISCDACRAAMGIRDNKTSTAILTKARTVINKRKLIKLSDNSPLNRNLIWSVLLNPSTIRRLWSWA